MMISSAFRQGHGDVCPNSNAARAGRANTLRRFGQASTADNRRLRRVAARDMLDGQHRVVRDYVRHSDDNSVHMGAQPVQMIERAGSIDVSGKPLGVAMRPSRLWPSWATTNGLSFRRRIDEFERVLDRRGHRADCHRGMAAVHDPSVPFLLDRFRSSVSMAQAAKKS